MEAFDGLRLRFRYEMRKDDRVVLEAHSERGVFEERGADALPLDEGGAAAARVHRRL